MNVKLIRHSFGKIGVSNSKRNNIHIEVVDANGVSSNWHRRWKSDFSLKGYQKR